MCDKTRKDFIGNFGENFNLKIIITTNLKIAIFLEVILDICTGRYMKIYDYPRNIIKALSDRISKRISNISPHKVMFDNATPFYNYGLPTRGYKKSSTYQKTQQPSNRVGQRKIMSFNPPYNVNVGRNIRKAFLKNSLGNISQKPKNLTEYSAGTMS